MGVLKVFVDVQTKAKLEELKEQRYRGVGTVSELVRMAIREFLERVDEEVD